MGWPMALELRARLEERGQGWLCKESSDLTLKFGDRGRKKPPERVSFQSVVQFCLTESLWEARTPIPSLVI